MLVHKVFCILPYCVILFNFLKSTFDKSSKLFCLWMWFRRNRIIRFKKNILLQRLFSLFQNWFIVFLLYLLCIQNRSTHKVEPC